MDFEDIHLREADQRRQRIDDEILAHLGLFADSYAPNRFRAPRLCMLHEHAINAFSDAAGGNSFRTMYECERSIDEVRQYPVGNGLVIQRQVEFGGSRGRK